MKLNHKLAIAFVGLVSTGVSAQMAPIPRSLSNASGGVCLKIANNGTIADAFLIVSTGSESKDRDLLAYAKQLQWPAQKRDGEVREVWFPMALASGKAKPPQMPKSCAPSHAEKQDELPPNR